MNNVKISIIGAGGSFTVGLIHDLCLTPNLYGSIISLMDINEDRLNWAYNICERYIKEMEANFKIEKTTDRRDSLKGADFVITTALIDGPRRLRDGWTIAEKHGIKWGGSYHILYDEPFWLNYYQLRLFESITEDMIEICPNAWHLLVSNPVLAGTTYLYRKYPNIKLVGLCHGFAGVYEIAEVLGLEKEYMTFEIAGVNHFIWLTHAYYKGQDIFPMIDEWLKTKAEEYWKTHPEGTLGKKKMDLYRKLGAIPIGDTASITGASWPWWYHSDKNVEEQWGADSRKWWWEYIDYISNTPNRLRAVAEDQSVKIAEAFQLDIKQLTGEPMIPIIESIVCDIPRIIIVNIQNDGEYVPGIPKDFEVEIPALVSKRGIEGIRTKGLPKPIIAHILRDRVAPVEIELEAYNKGSRNLLVQLVLTDKWITSEKHANELIDDIFALPYHKELREHYR